MDLFLSQGERMVVERLGKLSAIERPGWFFAIPVIDNIAYRVSAVAYGTDTTAQQTSGSDGQGLVTR